MDTKEVSAFLADSVNQLRRGRLDPRVANAMGYLTNVLLRALEQGPIAPLLGCGIMGKFDNVSWKR
jgi:hypothetical protein